MEDPRTWGKAEHIVNTALTRHNEQVARDKATGQFRADFSLTRKITDALRKAGLLKEE